MRTQPRSFIPLRSVAVSAAILLAAGCATAQHRSNGSVSAGAGIAPSTYLAAESPMPGTSVIQSADFSLKAAQQGYRTEVRNGAVLYCWADIPAGSKIPRKACLNETQLRMRMEQAERQRQAMQHGLLGTCPLNTVCN